MMYECYNKIGERIGVAYTKKDAEEMIKRANWELDLKRGTPEYEQRKLKAERRQKREMNEVAFGLVVGIALLVFGVICAASA